MRKWIWIQARDILTQQKVDELLDNCQDLYTDLVVSINFYAQGVLYPSQIFPLYSQKINNEPAFNYLIEQANRRSLNIHAWFSIGRYEDWSIWKMLDLPENFNTRTLPDCEVGWLNMSLLEARQQVADVVQDILDNTFGLSGIHLDYIRYQNTMLDVNGLSPDDITKTVKGIRAITNIELTAAVIHLYDSNNNWSPEGLQQDWPNWITSEMDLLDYALAMNYTTGERLQEKLPEYKLLENQDRIINGVSVTEYNNGENRYYIEVEWQSIMNASVSAGYPMAIFDYANSISRPYYNQYIKRKKETISESMTTQLSVIDALVITHQNAIDMLQKMKTDIQGIGTELLQLDEKLAVLAEVIE